MWSVLRVCFQYEMSSTVLYATKAMDTGHTYKLVPYDYHSYKNSKHCHISHLNQRVQKYKQIKTHLVRQNKFFFLTLL